MKRLIPCALLLVACSKVNVYTSAEKPQTVAPPTENVQIPALPVQARPLTTSERIAEIEKQLAVPLTGRPEDSDRRAQLRAERNALMGQSSAAANRSTGVSLPPTQPGRPQDPAFGIVVARDSQGQTGQNRLGFQALTPSEKKDYFKTLRLSRPDIVIEDRR